MPKNDLIQPQSEAVPRFVVRQMLLLIRMSHLAFQNMNEVFAVLTPELKATYEPFANIEIRPSFDDVMKLIDVAEERGIVLPDEASGIRAAKVRDIQNPIPDLEPEA